MGSNAARNVKFLRLSLVEPGACSVHRRHAAQRLAQFAFDLAAARLGEAARHRRQIHAQLRCELPLRRQPVSGPQRAVRDRAFDESDDLQVTRTAVGDEHADPRRTSAPAMYG